MKAACIQTVSGADMAENIAAIERLAAKAADEGAELIALPENAFQMVAPGAAAEKLSEAEHPGIAAAKEWAARHGAWILIGSAAVLQKPDALPVNRSLLINPQGEVAARYDKLHLFDVELPNGERYAESAKFAPGETAVVAETPWGALGMTICYDVRFPHLYRALAQKGAAMLAVPAAFTRTTGKAHWHVLLRARAIENGCFVLAPAQAGEHPGGRWTFGRSLIIDPWGEVLAEGGAEGWEVISAELDLSRVAEVRARIPSLKLERGFE